MYLVIKKKPFADSKWNKRATSTLLAGFEIVVSNTLCYFFKKILVWILGVRYFAVIFTIISEYGTLPLKDIRKSLKRQKKRAAYSEGLEDQNNRMQRPLIYIEKQDIFNVVFFLVSVLSGTYANAHAAQRMPIGKALPDLVHDFFKCGEEIRGAEEFLKMHAIDVKKAVQRIDTTSDDNLENVLYHFVINLWHKGTPVESAHRLFGEEVIKQLNVNGDIADKDADLIDVSVAAAIAADFLVNNLLIIK